MTLLTTVKVGNSHEEQVVWTLHDPILGHLLFFSFGEKELPVPAMGIT